MRRRLHNRLIACLRGASLLLNSLSSYFPARPYLRADKHYCVSLKLSHQQTNTTNTLAHSNPTVAQ